MENTFITVQATVSADKQKVWNCYTQPEHITQWNFADPSWHCPEASNELTQGGKYFARMEAKDGSFGFDFEAIYSEVNLSENFTYVFGGRLSTVTFTETNGQTEVSVRFEAETENSIEMQQHGWQSILDNFVNYVESN